VDLNCVHRFRYIVIILGYILAPGEAAPQPEFIPVVPNSANIHIIKHSDKVLEGNPEGILTINQARVETLQDTISYDW